MRKVALLAFILITGNCCYAQIPILTATSNMVAGDFYIAYATDTFNPGAAGAALTWNFDTLHNYGPDTTFEADCSASPYCGDFPGTTVYQRYSGGTESAYFNTSATALSFVGEYEAPVPIDYTNYEDELRYPFSYDSSFIDTFESVFISAGYTYHRYGSVTVRADAYGTLVLPTGTYNALRVKSTENFNDSTIYLGAPLVYSYYSLSYTWYTPRTHIELLNIVRSYRDAALISISTYFTQPDATAVAQVPATGTAVSVFPNPAAEQVSIRSDVVFEAGSWVDIYAMNGAHAGKYPLSGNNTIIPVAQLAPGLYECRISRPGYGIEVKKLVVAR